MNEMMERYWRYKETLDTMGEIKLSEPIKTEDISEAVKQSCYKEMRVLKDNGIFKGTLIDYLCWISANYIFFQVFNHAIQLKSYTKYRRRGGMNEPVEIVGKGFKQRPLIYSFLTVCYNNRTISINMLRLWTKNPEILITLYKKMVDEFKPETQMDIVSVMIDFYKREINESYEYEWDIKP